MKYVSSPLFNQILAQRPDVQLDRLENESPDDIVTPILDQAHVYQIGASRQVIAPHFQVADRIARTHAQPGRGVIERRRLRHRRCRCLHARRASPW